MSLDPDWIAVGPDNALEPRPDAELYDGSPVHTESYRRGYRNGYENVRRLTVERDLLLARQDALVRYLGRDDFLRAIGDADPNN